MFFVYKPFLGNSARSENQKYDRFKFLEFQIHVFRAMNINGFKQQKNSNSNELLTKVI